MVYVVRMVYYYHLLLFQKMRDRVYGDLIKEVEGRAM